jgi:large subunit ribosomal protein L10
MSKDRAAKQVVRENIKGCLGRANAAIVSEYRGLTVAELTELRIELRKVDSEFRVINNRIAKKAVEDGLTDIEPMKDLLKGPVGVVYLYGDAAAGAKAVLKFAKTNEKFKVTGGVMEGSRLSENDLKALADLPSKEVLLAQIIGTLVAPHRGILGVLNGVTRNLVQVINAIKDKKA